MNDNVNKLHRYSKITEPFLNHPIHDGLSSGAFLLFLHYITLASDGNHPDPKLRWKFRTKIDDLAKHKRLDRQVLDRYNKELQDYGHIQKKQGGNIPGIQIKILRHPESDLDLALSQSNKAKNPDPDSGFITYRQSYKSGFITFRGWLYHKVIKLEKGTNPLNLLNTNSSETKNAKNQLPKQRKQERLKQTTKRERNSLSENQNKIKKENQKTAQTLLDFFLKEFPNHKAGKDLKKWEEDVRLMLETDGRSSTQIINLWEWARSHKKFWSGRIKSPGDLRKKFDDLDVESKPYQTPEPDPAILEELDRQYRNDQKHWNNRAWKAFETEDPEQIKSAYDDLLELQEENPGKGAVLNPELKTKFDEFFKSQANDNGHKSK